MAILVQPHCPKCARPVIGVFPVSCPHGCGFSISGLAGRGTSQFQTTNWNKHSDILQGRSVPLHGGTFNASLNFRGHAALDDLVRFAITFGDPVAVAHRGHTNPAIICYVPEVIGSGTSLYSPGTVACSGLMLMSPASIDYAHSYPVLDEWMKQSPFHGAPSNCKQCGRATVVGQPLCSTCHSQGFDWVNMLGP
jgi:hypothetical protein